MRPRQGVEGERLLDLLPQVAPQLERARELLERLGPVAFPSRQVAGGRERSRKHRRRRVLAAERVAEPLPALGEVRACVPEPAERAGERELVLGTRGRQPVQRSAQVLVLELESRAVLDLCLDAPRVGLLRELDQALRVPGCVEVLLTALLEPLGGELADRL